MFSRKFGVISSSSSARRRHLSLLVFHKRLGNNGLLEKWRNNNRSIVVSGRRMQRERSKETKHFMCSQLVHALRNFLWTQVLILYFLNYICLIKRAIHPTIPHSG
mmetsp:Transcript_33419/g.70242  ORF Transcript_33419/g.70242 Transcript_33419/m.70242 type:complete len:105 (-) Transcript_33419:140-454(-)